MKHQMKVSITGRDGLSAEVVCADHAPCAAREVFDWDMANSMEQYQGEPIEFPAVDIDVIYADEDEGFVWAQVDHEVGGQ
jgi:hypothetical protein